MQPEVGAVEILDTAYKSITLQARVNVTNPTPYTARIPAFSVHVLSNGSLVGAATAENLDIVRGKNTNLLITAKWNPSMGGDRGDI